MLYNGTCFVERPIFIVCVYWLNMVVISWHLLMMYLWLNSAAIEKQKCKGRNKNGVYLLYFGVSDGEDAECVARHYFGSLQSHHNITIFLAVLCRPVLVAFSL